jgi:asparagine synthase (glutamine-hydrolysing)
MCGIAGSAGLEARDRAPAMRAMRERLIHRGPDSGGEHVDEHVALGVRRLRVIDLLTGDMPIANEDGTVWVVCNGEIYNYRELREELHAKGHRFNTSSDTEVIVHLYEEHGEGFVERIEGMFAISLWDARTRTLVLARDRMGKKPLLYAEIGGDILWASEHSALLESLTSVSVELSAVRLYLRLGYVPAPGDAFTGIRKLLPAHVLVWREGQSRIRPYWSPPAPATLRIGEREAVTELRRLIDRAVARRLVADVPIGAFLSGGVDSSVVVASMASQATRVRTFTIAFTENEYSEAPYARAIANRFGTEHHEFVVRPLDVGVITDLVRHYGEPYADSSALPTYFLSRVTRQHVTVALNGDGGDEIFAGYERYFASSLAARFDAVPAPLRAAVARAVGALLPATLSPRSRSRRARRFLDAVALRPTERYLQWVGVFDAVTLDGLLAPEFAAATDPAESAFVRDSSAGLPRGPVAAAQYHDLAHYLPEDLLVKVDIASMANSLEVRSPLLDRELVEFALRLPMELKIRGGERKYLLKKAFDGVLPRENMYRRKQGFALPIGEWFRGELRGLVLDTVLSTEARTRGYFRTDALERLVHDHVEGRADHTHRLWALLMLELWHREVVSMTRRAVAA